MGELGLVEVAWARPGVSSRAIVGRHSARHLMLLDAERPLCGVRVPWGRVHASHEGDCGRCFTIARVRGLREGADG